MTYATPIAGGRKVDEEAGDMRTRRRPIAERELTWTNLSGARHPVSIRLWAPMRDGRQDYLCYYAVDGLPEPVRSSTGGGDSLQALQLAMLAIKLILKTYAYRLKWYDSSWIGMPFEFDLTELREEQLRLERLVEGEIERYFEKANAPVNISQAELSVRYDPNAPTIDYSAHPTDDVIEYMRAASAREHAFTTQGMPEGAFIFSQKRWPMFNALKSRADYNEVLRVLTELPPR